VLTYHLHLDSPRGVGVDFGKYTRFDHFLPANANAFDSTELREVYLTPKVPIGHVRLFTPPLLLLSKLAMPNREHKLNKDLLDVERLLSAEELGLRLGLRPEEFAHYLDAMQLGEFRKLERIVGRLCMTTDFGRMPEADRMNEWEWQRLHFPKPKDKALVRQLKEKNYEHWHSIFSLLEHMFAVSLWLDAFTFVFLVSPSARADASLSVSR